jgi:hypothetical protein
MLNFQISNPAAYSFLFDFEITERKNPRPLVAGQPIGLPAPQGRGFSSARRASKRKSKRELGKALF